MYKEKILFTNTWKLFRIPLYLGLVLKAEVSRVYELQEPNLQFQHILSQNGDSVLPSLSTTAFFELYSHISFLPELNK